MTATPTPSMPQSATTSAGTRGNFLSRLTVPQKMLTAVLLASLPYVTTVGVLGSDYWQRYRAADSAAELTKAFDPLQSIQRNVRVVNGLSAEAAPPEVVAAISADAQRVQEAINATDIAAAEELAQSIATKAAALSQRITDRSISQEEIITETESLLSGEILQSFRVLTEQGNLYSTPSAEARTLVNMTSAVLPTTFPNIGSIYGELMVLANQIQTRQGGVPTAAQRQDIERRIQAAERSLAEVQTESARLFEQSPRAAETLSPTYKEALDSTASALEYLQTNLADAERITVSQQELEAASDYFDSQYAAFSGTVGLLEQSFSAERDRTWTNLLSLLIGLIFVTTVLYFLLRAIINAITKPLSQLTQAAGALSRGQFGARVPITSSDELGALGTTFNAAAAQLEENERRVEAERLEQERLQNNIGQFLDVTMDIAEGDLTKRGVVTEDVLGNVVDSINLMTEELGYVLGNVQKASTSVTSGSRQMLSSAENIRQGTAQTTEAALNVAQQTAEVNRQIQDMAQLAQATAEAARQALLASGEGQQAVQETLSGMQGIRATAQTAEERIAALAERSKQIGQIVDTISGIASQTNLLSLHASIEAAGAGDAGERFSVVADEVRQLADESAQATRQITGLIKGIQTEIAEVVRTMRENAEQVNQGYAVAGTAGQRLEQIGELSRESARLAEQISISTREQVQNIEQVSSSVQDIAQTAERSQQSVEQGRAAAEQLQQLADQLNASLTRFRLPS